MPDTLIVRLPNWLGDTVMAVPAVRALRGAREDARLALVGPWATLLAGQELADVLVPYARSWTGRLGAWDEIRALGASLAVLLPNSFEAALAARYWGATRRVGFDVGGRGRLLTDRVPAPAPRPHQIDEYALVVEALDVRVDDRVPRLLAPPAGSEAWTAARALLRDVGAGEAPPIGIHLGAAYGSSKVWPSERVTELCRLLADRDVIAVLLGTPDDVEAAGRIVSETGVRSLVGRDNPGILTALLAQLGALVCGDTGVGHLAAALATPVVALFGPTDGRLCAPRGPTRTIDHAVPCAPCFYRTCPIEHPCLRGIEAREVVEALDALLAPTHTRAVR
jgi:heptosyltransferase II